jgi:amidohydrolase
MRLPSGLQKIAAKSAEIVRPIRRDIHTHPEVGYKEKRTSALITEFLKELGLEVRTGIARTGVVGVLRSGRKGPTIALRADMDALPIQEETGLAHASVNDGVMHACGHDGHTAILLGTANALVQMKKHLVGNVIFMFQPAEEGGAGGKRMCEEGCLDDPKADLVFALHCRPQEPLGHIGLKAGIGSSQSDMFKMTVLGRDCHGSRPDMGTDPIVIAARVVDGLQSIVSREVAPFDIAVITVGTFHGGTASNQIPDKVELSGTVRTFNPEVREKVKKAMRRVLTNTTKAHGASYKMRFYDGYPPVINDPGAVELIRQVGEKLLGKDSIQTYEYPSMGAEDYAYYLHRIPGAMFQLGLAAKDCDDPHKLHANRFDFNDDALQYGIAMMAGVVFAGQQYKAGKGSRK